MLRPYLKADPEAYIFNPADSVSEEYAARRASRKTPIHYGNSPGTNRRRWPKRQAGERYDVNAYRRAIERGCERAFNMPDDLKRCPKDTAEEKATRAAKRAEWHAQHCWTPHQLRHTAATRLRGIYQDLESVQVILGHKTLEATQIYAKKSAELAKRIAAEHG